MKLKTLMFILGGICLLVAVGVAGIVLSAGDRPGATATGARKTRMLQSPQWKAGQFRNELKRVDGSLFQMGWQFFFGGQAHRTPEKADESIVIEPRHLMEPSQSSDRVTWFGHSSLLVEMSGLRVLIDPVWGDRASPFTWSGPKRFYRPPIALKALGPIDAVIISHDHYDHLDMETVQQLVDVPLTWICPLGVGAHLEKWGVAFERIVELDWWEKHTLGEVEITATPSRHFSGRSVLFMDQNQTLWAGWAMTSPTSSVFYSGDTALHPEFGLIGERLGPFDLTILEIGAYDALWADVHLGPEQALIAHQLLKGKRLLPVHWGTFDLALHGWTEPIERLLSVARGVNVDVAVPRPGGFVKLAGPAINYEPWWPENQWRTAQDAPAWSSGVEALQAELKSVLEQSSQGQ